LNWLSRKRIIQTLRTTSKVVEEDQNPQTGINGMGALM